MSRDEIQAGKMPRNAIAFPLLARRAIIFVARFVNPLVLAIAGRRWMPVVGILHHRGRRTGRAYATPLGMRPLGDGFVMPRTLSQHSAWYQNVQAAGSAEVTWAGAEHRLDRPQVVDAATAELAFPRYERFLFCLLGIDEFLLLRRAAAGAEGGADKSPGPLRVDPTSDRPSNSSGSAQLLNTASDR